MVSPLVPYVLYCGMRGYPIVALSRVKNKSPRVKKGRQLPSDPSTWSAIGGFPRRNASTRLASQQSRTSRRKLTDLFAEP